MSIKGLRSGLRRLRRHHVETARTVIGQLGLLCVFCYRFLMLVEIMVLIVKTTFSRRKTASVILFFRHTEVAQLAAIAALCHSE